MFFEKMEEADRIRFLQASLAARNYDLGAIDGIVGPQTRGAIALFERDAGLPPSGGRVALPLLTAIAQARIARGEDIRQPPRSWGTSGEAVRIVPNVPYGSYFVGQRLRAQVVSPRAGHMTCMLTSPDGGTVSLYPLIDSRPTAVSARAPLFLPAATDGPGQPRVTLKQAGPHALYCALTRTELSARLPANLRPGADGRSVQLVEAQTALRRTAGPDWIADGLATFDVAPVTVR
jgi:peptidoglycan hydrolase-like protein with peptidoglycan-binding domain